MSIPVLEQNSTTYELDRAHVFHSWSAQAHLDPLVIESADGCQLFDAEGNRYLDFSSQLVYTNIGHQHPKVVAAIQEQAARLCTVAPSHATSSRSTAAELITEKLPRNINRLLFTNGGADAVEHAIRLARLHTGRYKVLSAFRGYHGATQQAMNISGDNRRWPSDYGNSGAVHFFGPFLYRSAYHATTEAEECARALDALDNLIAFEGPDSFAAIILETIPGTAGFMPPPEGFLAGVRDLCDRYGILMILDEVMMGFGRTGTWFALDHYGVAPDLVTMAKGINSGYVPMGAVGISDEVAATFADRPYPGGLTYSGHPLAAAASVAAITAMEEEGIVDNAAWLGEAVFGPALEDMHRQHPSLGDVRGMGAFWALDLVTDRETKQPLSPYGQVNDAMKSVLNVCTSNRLLVFSNMHRIHLTPPLTLTAKEAQEGLAIIDQALEIADTYYTGSA